MKTSRTLLVFTIAASALLLASCGSSTPLDTTATGAAPTIKYAKIISPKKGYFSEELRLIGKISANKETSVSPLVSGTVKEIYVDAGARVKEGQILARIDLENSSFQTSYQNALTSYGNLAKVYSDTQSSVSKDLDNAAISLQNTIEARDNLYITTEKQLRSSEIALKNGNTTQSNTTTSTSEAIKSSEIAIDLSQEALKNANTSLENFEKTSVATVSSLQTKKKNAYSSLSVALRNSLSSLDTALSSADIILGVSDKNRNANVAYSQNLGAKNAETRRNAEDLWRQSNKDYQDIKNISTTGTNGALDSSLVSVLSVVKETEALYDGVISMLSNTVTSSTFSQTQLDALNSSMVSLRGVVLSLDSSLTSLQGSLADLEESISGANTSIETNRLSLQNAVKISETQLANAKQALVNAKASKNSAIDSAQGGTSALEAALESTVASIKSARNSADNGVSMAKKSYESQKESLNIKLTSAKAQLDAARGQLDLAKIQLDNSVIKAPFSGVVMAKNVEVGTLVSPSVAIFTVGDPSALKVKMDVSPDVLSTLAIGQKLTVARGATSYSGSITVLPPSVDATKTAKIEALITSPSTGLNLGDVVNVYGTKEDKSAEVIMIPFSAVLSAGQGKYSVFLVGTDGVAQSKEVSVGRQSTQWVVVDRGLGESDKLVSEGSLNISSGDIVKELTEQSSLSGSTTK